MAASRTKYSKAVKVKGVKASASGRFETTHKEKGGGYRVGDEKMVTQFVKDFYKQHGKAMSTLANE